jgi:hypothetical protein
MKCITWRLGWSGDSDTFMPDEVDRYMHRGDAGRHCTTKRILEMIPLHTGLKRKELF